MLQTLHSFSPPGMSHRGMGRYCSPAAIYATIALLTIIVAFGSTLNIRSRLHHSTLVEAHFSRMVENTGAFPLPAHIPIFVAATTEGKVELMGLSTCNCTHYRLGERTKLWLNPADPRVVVPNRLIDVWFFPLLMVFAATGFSIFALLARRFDAPAAE